MGKKENKMFRRVRATILFLLILSFCVGAGLVFTPIFHISEVFCEGNDRIPAEEIIATADVQMGKNIFLQRLSEVKKRVAEVPMIEEVKVRRIFPNKVKIWVRECMPAGYIIQDGQAVMIDVDGKVLEIIEDERVSQLIAAYKPIKKETEKQDKKEKKETETEEQDIQEEIEEPVEESAETVEEPKEIPPPEGVYAVPVVEGIKLEKPQVGKIAESKERDKYSQMMETFQALEASELLVRVTYINITNPADVMLMVENRLEVQLGTLDNIEYRCQFLGTVIREKIGAAEVAVIDYRGKDLYVRPPEDGKERMVPKPTAEPEPTQSAEPEDEDE